VLQITVPIHTWELLSFDMMSAFQNLLSFVIDHDTIEDLGLYATVFDWTRLGVFKGSRVSEYAKAKSKDGTYLRVPTVR
jgi:hypothetical protein